MNVWEVFICVTKTPPAQTLLAHMLANVTVDIQEMDKLEPAQVHLVCAVISTKFHLFFLDTVKNVPGTKF